LAGLSRQHSYFENGFNLSTGLIHHVENYTAVSPLAPFRGEGESNPDKTEADNHVPGTDSGYWVTGRGHIEDDNPDESSEKGSDHYRG
jgi:hypothetical protein